MKKLPSLSENSSNQTSRWDSSDDSVRTQGHQVITVHRSTHRHPGVERWLAAHPRYQVHCTPTYASWHNQMEIWFNLITQRAIRRGTFMSVKELIAKIEQFVIHYNRNLNPFAWKATAGPILEKIKRLGQRISEAQLQEKT
jgi:putative transposase